MPIPSFPKAANMELRNQVRTSAEPHLLVGTEAKHLCGDGFNSPGGRIINESPPQGAKT